MVTSSVSARRLRVVHANGNGGEATKEFTARVLGAQKG